MSLWSIVLIVVLAFKVNSLLYRGGFPKDFVFGVATSAFQYEGAAREEGRGPSIWDSFAYTPGKIQDGSNADVAVDQYHLYKEDVKLLVELGVDAYRLSISWSRIYPSGRGRINKQGIDYYNRLIDELLNNGIKPFVTLNHFDVPQALEDDYRSWLSPRIVDDFVTFAETCFEAFGDRVKHWITLNEPHIISNYAYNLGVLAPGRCSNEVGINCSHGNSSSEPYLAGHYLLLSHAKAVQSYRSTFKAKQCGIIGISLDAMWFDPYSNAPNDLKAAERARDFNLGWMMDPIMFGQYPENLLSRLGDRLPHFTKEQENMLRGSADFVGINHYSSLYVADIGNKHLQASPAPDFNQQAYSKDTSMHVIDTRRNGRVIGRSVNGVYIYPEGIRKLLNYIRLKYNNPWIYITENGISDVLTGPVEQVLNDTVRVNYLRRYLGNLAAAIKDGCNVKGYFVWSLMDNWEWSRGFAVKYGLYHVDYTANLTRTPKQSALWYRNLLTN